MSPPDLVTCHPWKFTGAPPLLEEGHRRCHLPTSDPQYFNQSRTFGYTGSILSCPAMPLAFMMLLIILLHAGERQAAKISQERSGPKVQHKNPQDLPTYLQSQSYDCDIYGFTKAASVSRTQFSRTKRIQKAVSNLEKYSSQENTNFDTIISLMNMTTENGTSCLGAPLNASSVAVYNILTKCKESIPTICNMSLVSSFNQAVNSSVWACEPLLSAFGGTFKVSWTQLYIPFPRTACSKVLTNSFARKPVTWKN